MFGLFKSKREKEQLKLLKELDEAGAAQSSDPVIRRRHAHLVHMLRSEGEALPLYEAIAADHPESVRTAMIAASIRLGNGDPRGLEAMERVAMARPSLALPALRSIIGFHERLGNEQEIERLMPLFGKAMDNQKSAVEECRFDDPGGPLEPPRYDEQDRQFIAFWLDQHCGGVSALQLLLAGSRTLDDGSVQQVWCVEAAPDADEQSVVEEVVELVSMYGDFVLRADRPDWRWLRDELSKLEGAQLYP